MKFLSFLIVGLMIFSSPTVAENSKSSDLLQGEYKAVIFSEHPIRIDGLIFRPVSNIADPVYPSHALKSNRNTDTALPNAAIRDAEDEIEADYDE